MEVTQTGFEIRYKEDYTKYSQGANRQAEGNPARMGELLPHGKHSSQTQGDRPLAAQQIKVLRLGGLEENRAKKEESYSSRNSNRPSLCVE